MDFAGEEAAPPASTDVYLLDLVRYEPPKKFNLGGLRDRGVVITLGHTNNRANSLKLLRVDGSVVSVKPGNVTVIDRSYIAPSMVVGSAADLGGGQIGVVTGGTTLLDLVRLDDPAAPVIRGVPTSTPGLRRVRPLNLGDFVVSGPWLGRVFELSVDVDVLLGDGTVRRFTNVESKQQILELEAKYTKIYRNVMGRYYPGMDVYGNPSAALKPYRSLHGRETGTVVKVEVSDVLVHWVASPHCGTDKDLVMASAPPAHQKPHDLTYFCSASESLWMVSDRCFLGAPAATGIDHDDGDHAAASTTSRNQQPTASTSTPPAAPAVETTTTTTKKSYLKQQQRKLFFKRQRREHRLDQIEVPMSVLETRTTVDVLWQDGTRQLGVPSTSLIPFAIMNANELFPGNVVVENAPPPTTAAAVDVAGDHDDDGSTTTTTTRRRAGVVRSLNTKDQTVRVSWFKAAASRPDGEAGSWGEVECGDETVSAYDLRRHTGSIVDPFYGNIVVRRRLLPSGPNDGESTAPAVQQPADLSWVGHVVDLPDGKVLVKWGDGSTSTVLPHEICAIVEYHLWELLAEMGEWVEDDDGVDDAPPPELAGADQQNPPTDGSNVNGGGDDSATNADGAPAAVLAGGELSGVVRSVISLAAEVLARGSSYVARWSSSSSSSSKPPAVMEDVEAPALDVSGSDHDNGGATEANDDDASLDTSEEEEERGEKATDSTAGGGDDDSFRFPRFDVVHSPLDHHYLDSMDQGGSGEKKWVKAVHKEWKILENDLPDTICARAFEDRMDLLRAVMVGASGTPYHDGLFFFDMQLPPSYPAVPPQVYYHSFGLRINPNLYPSGTVCLSLLNTFDGEGTEAWSPAASSLLQVVVSIQGLVLNDEPYYNEAGFEALVGKPEGRRNALPYGENAYLLSLRTALNLLRRPPQGFEEFVRDHFRRRGRFVLRACEAYLQGCAVGTLTDDARATEVSMERQCSNGLRLALANMVPNLVSAFKEIGAEGCDEFQDLRCPALIS